MDWLSVRGGSWPSDMTSVISRFLGDISALPEWLEAQGIRLLDPMSDAVTPARGGVQAIVPNGRSTRRALVQALTRAGGRIVRDSRVTGLEVSDARVTGVRTDAGTHRARRGVVLATGGYGASRVCLNQTDVPPGRFAWERGDGHELLASAGVALRGMEVVIGHALYLPPEPASFALSHRLKGPALQDAWQAAGAFIRARPGLRGWLKISENLFREGAILVNRDGDRFCNEEDVVSRSAALAGQPDGLAWILIDTRLYTQFNQRPCFLCTADVTGNAFVDDVLRDRRDVAIQADAPEVLAEVMAMDPARLRETVGVFNQYASGRRRDAFGRRGDMRPLEGLRWLLVGPVHSRLSGTCGGPVMDAAMRPVRQDEGPLLGVHLAGALALSGTRFPATGFDLAWSFVTGRWAGEAAASDG
jgi:fumarate reductase flavoprotein subunit